MKHAVFGVLIGVVSALALSGCDSSAGGERMDHGQDARATGHGQDAHATSNSEPTANTGDMTKMEKATFAAGCFWGVEATFRQVEGVTATQVGYTGGDLDNPTYKDVCTDKTGHAEAVEVTFDPEKVGYEKLLAIFWENHDPTQVNRQGPDYGKQYRSAIFYHSDEQKAAAEAAKKALGEAGKYSRPIATEIVPAGTFWRAEEYHQQYLEKRGLATCNL